jgi:phage/plasmid-like protein (TIGR03299 family)
MSDTETQQFSARTVPWLKVGTQVEAAVTATEAIELAGLDWEVAVRKDGFQTAGGTWRVDPEKRKIVRVDTEQPLGTVSKDYKMLQYSEAFDFMNEISPHFVAAGQLRGGRQAFVVVEAPGYAKLETLGGEDEHDLYVVLRASHDGTRAIEVNLLPLRGACMNMLPAANFGRSDRGYNAKARQRWSVRHTKNMRVKLEQARAVIDGTEAYAAAFNEMAERLAAIELTLEQATEVIAETVPAHLSKPERVQSAILNLYQNSRFNGYRGTGWGVLNAVTEYYDHFRGSERRAAETRWVQGLDGTTTRAINHTIEVLRAR